MGVSARLAGFMLVPSIILFNELFNWLFQLLSSYSSEGRSLNSFRLSKQAESLLVVAPLPMLVLFVLIAAVLFWKAVDADDIDEALALFSKLRTLSPSSLISTLNGLSMTWYLLNVSDNSYKPFFFYMKTQIKHNLEDLTFGFAWITDLKFKIRFVCVLFVFFFF